MTIQVLDCRADGTQVLETREVPDLEPTTPEISAEDTLLDMAADHEERLCMLELNS